MLRKITLRRDNGKTYTEDQDTINHWANSVFGPVISGIRGVGRLNQEMAELVDKAAMNEVAPVSIEALKDEAADVAILLFRYADYVGFDLLEEVDRKMTINRERKWNPDGTGYGNHIK